VFRQTPFPTGGGTQVLPFLSSKFGKWQEKHRKQRNSCYYSYELQVNRPFLPYVPDLSVVRISVKSPGYLPLLNLSFCFIILTNEGRQAAQ
jgi:hypothetical protein